MTSLSVHTQAQALNQQAAKVNRIKRKPPPCYDPSEFTLPSNLHFPEHSSPKRPRFGQAFSFDEHSFLLSRRISVAELSCESDFWESSSPTSTSNTFGACQEASPIPSIASSTDYHATRPRAQTIPGKPFQSPTSTMDPPLSSTLQPLHLAGKNGIMSTASRRLMFKPPNRRADTTPHLTTLQSLRLGEYGRESRGASRPPSGPPSIKERTSSIKGKLASLFGSSRSSLSISSPMPSPPLEAPLSFVLPPIEALGPMMDSPTASDMSSSPSDTIWDHDSREHDAYTSAVSRPLPSHREDSAKTLCPNSTTAGIHHVCSESPDVTMSPPDDSETSEFDEYALPTPAQLQQAASLCVIAESGVRVPFHALWKQQKTIVLFIRHFMCPLCQDYMFSISRNLSASVLRDAGMELVIISNGAPEMIASYRRIFQTPFAVYTDPQHLVYNALGMTLQTMEAGPRGTYVRHGVLGGIGMVVANAVKVGMPIWKDGGQISQLGGEFILGPGFSCSFAHRMRYTRSHLPILDLVAEAGVDMYAPLEEMTRVTGTSFLGMSPEAEAEWMVRRKMDLAELNNRKARRRAGYYGHTRGTKLDPQ